MVDRNYGINFAECLSPDINTASYVVNVFPGYAALALGRTANRPVPGSTVRFRWKPSPKHTIR